MKTIFAVIGVLAVLFVMAMFAVCDDPDDANSWARIQVAYHEQPRCDDGYDDCGGYDDGYGRGGDGGESGGHQGYGGGGGRSGDYDGGDGDGDRCRNICNNTFPLPGGGGGRG